MAVISDVHGNLPALKAVVEDAENWGVDLMIANGDIINNGPSSKECLDFIASREKKYPWIKIKGNHEDYVLATQMQKFGDLSEFHQKFYKSAYWTAERMKKSDMQNINSWQSFFEFHYFGKKIHITHASPHSREDGYVPRMTDEQMIDKLNYPCDIFITSHTHVAFTRQTEQCLFLNSGSVGRPFGDDLNPSYIQVELKDENIECKVARVFYDRHQYQQDAENSGFNKDCAPLSLILHQQFVDGRSGLGTWRKKYLEAVMRGELSLEESVNLFLMEQTK